VTSDKSDQREQEALAIVDDVAAEVAQSAIEIILSEDVLEHLPFVKGLVGVARSVVAVRDKLLLRKLETFLRALASIPQETRRDMVRRLEDDPVYTETVGEHIIELLDRLEGQRKAAMMGGAFAAFARKEIDRQMLHRLNAGIDRIQLGEMGVMRRLVACENGYLLYDENREAADILDVVSLFALVNAGFAFSASVWGGNSIVMTDVGRCFLHLNLDLV
jgi:hypothetical protein